MDCDFDGEMKSLQEQVDAFVSRMEGLRERFVSATADFLRSWYWTQAELAIKGKPEIAKELGVERLSEMKAAVKATCDNSEAAAARFLADDSIWWHRSQNDRHYYMSDPKKGPAPVDKAIRRAAGELAPVLKKYGYISRSNDRGSVEWIDKDDPISMHTTTARGYYPYSLDWPESMRSLMQGYLELCAEGTNLKSRLDALHRQKQESEAQRLWDQA